MRVPLAFAWSHVVREYQAGLWVIKSPMMMLSQKVKIWREIGRSEGNRWDVNVNFGGDILDDGCNGEVLYDGEVS